MIFTDALTGLVRSFYENAINRRDLRNQVSLRTLAVPASVWNNETWVQSLTVAWDQVALSRGFNIQANANLCDCFTMSLIADDFDFVCQVFYHSDETMFRTLLYVSDEGWTLDDGATQQVRRSAVEDGIQNSFALFFGVESNGLLTAVQRQSLRIGVRGRLATLLQDPVPIPPNQTTLERKFRTLTNQVFWQLVDDGCSARLEYGPGGGSFPNWAFAQLAQDPRVGHIRQANQLQWNLGLYHRGFAAAILSKFG